MADKYDRIKGVSSEEREAARKEEELGAAMLKKKEEEAMEKLSKEIDRKMPLSRVLKELRWKEENAKSEKSKPSGKKFAAGGVVRGAGRAIRGVRPARFV